MDYTWKSKFENLKKKISSYYFACVAHSTLLKLFLIINHISLHQ